MLDASDATIIRETLGSSVEMYTDEELVSDTRLRLAALVVTANVPDAAAETDPDRVFMIDVAQAYQIGIDLLSGGSELESSDLADSSLDMNARTDEVIRYWQMRYGAIVNRLRTVTSSPLDSIVVLATGSRG